MARKFETTILLSAIAGYIVLNFMVVGLLYFTGDERPLAIPLEGVCNTELDCPTRMFCYNNLEKSYLTHDSKDTEMLEGVCGCYVFLGEEENDKSVLMLPGTSEAMYPKDGYCTSTSTLKPYLLGLTIVVTLILLFTTCQLYRTMYQLIKVEAFNYKLPSSIALSFAVLAATFMVLLMLIYIVELTGLTPKYKMLDHVRPIFFGSFAACQSSALLQISVMWTDVYTKSKSAGNKKSSKTAKLRKAVTVLITMTILIVMTCFLLGLTQIASAWMVLILIGIAIAYKRGGDNLYKLLLPSDLTAPGATSAKVAADQIKFTANFIFYLNFIFVGFLAAYSFTIQRVNTGPTAFILVMCFFLCANAHQVRVMNYIRFGSRKKLTKAGFVNFRASVFTSSYTHSGGTGYGKKTGTGSSAESSGGVSSGRGVTSANA